MRILGIVVLCTPMCIIVLLTTLAGTPALAHVVLLAPATYMTTLCAANCTTATVTVPNNPDASVTIPPSIPGDGSSGASVQGEPRRDPSVFAGANAVGIGIDVRANISLQYYVEIFGPSGIAPAPVPVTVNTVLSVGGATLAGATWTSTAMVSLNGRSISDTASSINNSPSIAPSTLSFEKTLGLMTDTPYSINLSADVQAQSFVVGDAANTVFASVDPTLSVPNGYSIFFSDGIGNSVPEPSTWAMMLLGFASLGFMRIGGRARRSFASHDLASLCNRRGSDPHHRTNPQQAS
jgi:hypothetical protein